MTSIGFFSLTNHKTKPSDMMVRGRVRSDMERLVALVPKEALKSEIIDTHDSDYRYRIIADRKAMGDVFGKLVANMDYIGFKDHIGKKSGETREEVYYSVWGTLSVLADVEHDIIREEGHT